MAQKKKNSPKPAGLYLFNKSTSFILIKSILVQILRLLTFSFIRKGQRKIKDLDRESNFFHSQTLKVPRVIACIGIQSLRAKKTIASHLNLLSQINGRSKGWSRAAVVR